MILFSLRNAVLHQEMIVFLILRKTGFKFLQRFVKTVLTSSASFTSTWIICLLFLEVCSEMFWREVLARYLMEKLARISIDM